MSLSLYLFLSICPSVCLSVCVCVCLCLSVSLSMSLSLSVCLSSVCLSVSLSLLPHISYLPLSHNIMHSAIQIKLSSVSFYLSIAAQSLLLCEDVVKIRRHASDIRSSVTNRTMTPRPLRGCFSFQCCSASTETIRLIRDGEPSGWPPRLSHSV